jgi:hypothetical protein
MQKPVLLPLVGEEEEQNVLVLVQEMPIHSQQKDRPQRVLEVVKNIFRDKDIRDIDQT